MVKLLLKVVRDSTSVMEVEEVELQLMFHGTENTTTRMQWFLERAIA
jgi:hypothetical protein